MPALKGIELENVIKFEEATGVEVQACELGTGIPNMAFINFMDTPLLYRGKELEDLVELWEAWKTWEEKKLKFNRKYR